MVFGYHIYAMPVSTRSIALLAVLLLVGTAGCLGTFGGEDGEAEEIQEAAIAAMEDVETHTFEMTMSVDEAGQEFTMDTEGAVDYEEQEMFMEGSISQAGMTEDIEMYMFEDWMYMYIDGQWQSESLAEFGEDDLWEEDIEQQREYLERAEVELVDTTTIDGVDVNVLELDIDTDELTEMVLEDIEDDSDIDEDDLSIDEFDNTQYIRDEDDLLHAVDMSMTTTVSTAFGETSMSIDLEMSFDDYGEEVEIELPDDAYN